MAKNPFEERPEAECHGQDSTPKVLQANPLSGEIPPTSEQSVADDLKARINQESLLIEVNAALAGAFDAESVLGPILERLRERARLTNASIYLLDSERRNLRCAAEAGYLSIDNYRTLDLDGPGLIAWAARTGESVYVPDVEKDARYLCGDARIKSEYAVPLVGRSKVLGVLDLEFDRVDGLRATTRKLVDQFAPQAALAIERSELYKQLRSSEERFRSIFEQSQIGVALADLEGRFSAVNPAFARLLGYESEELVGKHYIEVTHPEDRALSLERVKELLDGEQSQFTLEKRYLHRSGEFVWCTAVVSVIRSAAGQPTYLMGMIQDITQRKRAEEEQARLQSQLFQSQKMEAIGTLAGGIAHDFNNLLGAIMGFASLARLRMEPDDPLWETIKMIEQSAESAADLTRRLLALARPEKPQSKPVNVKEIVGRVVKIASRTFDRLIQIKTRLAPDALWVEGDAAQLEQVLLNLLINARDAMPRGGTLTLEAAVTELGPDDPDRPEQCSPGEYAQIAVRDTGVGIEPHAVEHIFEPFFTTKERGQGSGLGLTIVQGIVSNHHGFIRAESQAGEGSKFTLYLPAARPPAETVSERKPARLETGTGTVLVVDDEPLILAFTQGALRKLGYQVVTTESGERALEVFMSSPKQIDYVLLDVVMPRMNGLETYQKLREINPQVRVILSSGYSAPPEVREAVDSGSVDFIEKPYTVEVLSLALKKIREAARATLESKS